MKFKSRQILEKSLNVRLIGNELFHANGRRDLTKLTRGVPRNFFRGVVKKIQLRTEDREWGSGGGSSLVRGSGGSCNLVQEISFHIVNFS
jgi:hypothetical protein